MMRLFFVKISAVSSDQAESDLIQLRTEELCKFTVRTLLAASPKAGWQTVYIRLLVKELSIGN